jgi:two-component system NarL family sensor kinase
MTLGDASTAPSAAWRFFGWARPVKPVQHDDRSSIQRVAAGLSILPGAGAEISTPVSHCCVTVDSSWRVTGMTPEAAAWLGASELDVLGTDLRSHSVTPLILAAIEAGLTTHQVASVISPSGHHPGRSVECVVHPTGAGVSVLFWEAGSEQKEASETSSHGNRKVEIALLDERGVIISVNAAWTEACAGFERNGASCGVGADYPALCARIIPHLDEEAFRLELADVVQNSAHGVMRRYVVGDDGTVRWRQLLVTPVRMGSATQLIAMHEDLTEAAQTHAALRATAERLLVAQEEERQRIALELHDSTSQHLTALGLGIGRLRRMAGSSARGDVLAEMTDALHEAVREIRVLSYLMTPPRSLDDGLETAVERFLTGFGKRASLTTTFRTVGDLAVGEAVEHAVFRVVQEALANVHRHANASSVVVEIVHVGGRLTTVIQDDGKGVGANGEGFVEGVGIASMQARMRQLGGTLEISSTPAGTIVTATTPIPPNLRPAPPQNGQG